MGTLLLRHARVLVTMDDTRREIADGGVFARDGWIEAVGASSDLPATADEVVDLSGHVVLPGLVNTHHHLFQTLTRALPGGQDAGLFDWLRHHYPIWARLTPDALRVATTLGLTELARSGCTTAFDHGYLFPPGCRVDDQIEGAAPVGIRFHVARGSMSLGASAGGLPPDDVVEDEDAILADTQRVVAAFHDPAPGAMTRVVVAPCSPFSVTPDAMRRSAELARDLGVRLHTHLAETLDEEDFCRSRLGCSPLAFAGDVGWLGDDVWFAHAVHVDAGGVATLAATGTGVAHCPSSNMRLASGVAPIRAYLDAGVPVGIGVDGSASNDSSHLLAEARQALLVARLAAAPRSDRPAGPLLPVRTALEMATRGGAAVLGRDDIGVLEPGRAADVVAFDLDRVGFAGGLTDPVGALLLCQPVGVSHSFVHGRAVVRDGHVVGIDVEDVLTRHRAASRRVVNGPDGH
jgi:cytosine/adenosine deaminase-related metal-dependent hydrolase